MLQQQYSLTHRVPKVVLIPSIDDEIKPGLQPPDFHSRQKINVFVTLSLRQLFRIIVGLIIAVFITYCF
jgi:hypothetical protein